MAPSKMSKTETKSNSGESSKTASKASKPRKEDLKKKKNKLSNGNVKEKDGKVLIFPSSSTEFLEEAAKGHETEIDNNGITNGQTSGAKPKKGKRKQQVDDYGVEGKEDAKTIKLPMNRIKTIVKAEDPHLRVSEEAIWVISKATVKFLEQFTREAYACSVQDRKKSLGYQRLSHVVGSQRRYDFLSDYVPKKLKAADALRKRNSCRDGEGLEM